MAKRNRDIKQGLLARKDELLKQLKYYEKRIDEARNKTNSSFHDESSDSEQEFTVHLEPSIAELKLKQSMLQTCLCATQELTSVQILQSEVNVISEPVFERDPSTKEEGIWREVTVECRIDLVPFSMNFYVHQPKCLFTPFLYKNLQVNPVKSAHEQELAISVLPAVDTPSDAVEVLRNYAKAHRSRRSTLAKLAETYGHTLFMESLPEGGYILKCADVLEVSWTLQNKWSPIAPFHHKMKFDLEYMDESYIKIITQLHRQLSDPSVETDERTLLLSKIINTCLQAKKQTDLTKNESNIDSNINKTKNINNKDSEIMAPPKLIPKKNKKRITDDYSSAKRAKVDNDKENSSNNNMSSKQIDKNKAKVNENKCKPISNYYNKEKNSNTQLSNKKLDKNNHLKPNEQKKEENTIKADKKLVNNKNKEINNKVTLDSDLKSVDKESTNKQIDKNNEPKTNEQNNDEKTKIDTKEKLKKNNKDKKNHQKRNEHNKDEKTKTDTKEKLMKNNKDKNNHQKTNEQNKEEKAKTDKKEQLIKNNKEKNFEPKTNERNINEIAKTNKNELLHKKNKDNLTSNSNSDIKSNNKISTKIIDKNKVDLKRKKGKVEEKKIRKDNKETLNTDKEKNEANIKLNEELSKKNNKSDSKLDKNNCNNKYNTEKDNTKFVTDLKSKNNVISNKEINKNKINNHKTKPKIIINNENKHKIETKSSQDLKTKNNIIQNKEINRNKIESKTKIGGNKFEIYRNKKKQSNLTNNSNLSNKERSKITSKIPKRIQSMELKKNMLRLSPRFIKKPSVKQ